MRALHGFVAGVLGTLVFHQIALAVLHAIGLSPFGAYPMAPTAPLGVPTVVSLAFWGGVWGIPYAFIHRRFPAGAGYWVAAFLFGAIATSFVGLFILPFVKGGPFAAGGNVPVLIVVFLINGAWGVGTGVVLRRLEGRFGRTAPVAA